MTNPRNFSKTDLYIAKEQDGNYTITFTVEGQLQKTTNVHGPWRNVTVDEFEDEMGIYKFYMVNNSPEIKKETEYFRLKLPGDELTVSDKIVGYIHRKIKADDRVRNPLYIPFNGEYNKVTDIFQDINVGATLYDDQMAYKEVFKGGGNMAFDNTNSMNVYDKDFKEWEDINMNL